VVVWAATAVAGIVPAPSSPHAVGAPAVAEAAARPALDSLIMTQLPLAYWPLQDATAAIADDRVGAHAGIGQGRLQVGRIGPGTTVTSDGFDGSTTQVIAPATGLAPVAVTAWLRTPRQRLGSFGTVVDTGGLGISVASGRVTASTCVSPTSCLSVRSPTSVTDGAWHQVALSVSEGAASLFVDGRLDAVAPSAGATAAPSDGLVRIGHAFRGNLDNIALFGKPLAAGAVSAQFAAGGCPQAAGTLPATTNAHASLPALPLHTSGRWIVDTTGKRVKLAGVNWYGADELDHVPSGLQCQSADAIAAHIAADGFNVVRLPWSTDAWDHHYAHTVPAIAVAANPQLRGANARQVLDAVIAALDRHGLMVILDNHVGHADWCCSNTDGNALWWESYDPARPPRWRDRTPHGKLHFFQQGQARWLRAWRRIAGRYSTTGLHPHRNVIGADLRNEPRSDTTLGLRITWRAGDIAPWVDWPRAARIAGNAVLHANPRLLVVVEGIDYATDLRGAGLRPIHLSRAHRLVYSAHDYAWFHPSAQQVDRDLGAAWGWLLIQHRSWTTPVWVGEYGSCHPDDSGCADGAWLSAIRSYLAAGDLDWSYWAINGTGGRGATEPTTCSATPHSPGCAEGYGIFDPTWSDDASAPLTADLRALEAATQSP
jgi:endoglucanase